MVPDHVPAPPADRPDFVVETHSIDYGRVNKAGMSAYLIGCLAQIPFANVPFYEGPLAKALSWSGHADELKLRYVA